METINFKIVSFDCKGFKYRMYDYVNKLFQSCDFLLLQEHWLLSSEFSNFTKYVTGASYCANTDMPHDRLVPGRPYGGAAILWHNNLNCKVDIINSLSGRLSSVLVGNGGRQFLFRSVYMPCYRLKLWTCLWWCISWNFAYIQHAHGRQPNYYGWLEYWLCETQ